MPEDLKNIIFILIITAGVFVLGRCIAPNSETVVASKIDMVDKKINRIAGELDSRLVSGRKFDTIVQEKILYRQIISYQDTGRIVYVGDSVHQSRAFIASVDTVLGDCDTLSFSYSYPQNSIFWQLRQCPDTVKTVFLSETIYETKIVARPLWLDVLSHTGASLVGFGIGYAIGR